MTDEAEALREKLAADIKLSLDFGGPTYNAEAHAGALARFLILQGWIKSPPAPVPAGAGALEERLRDAEADALRLHREKMDLYMQIIDLGHTPKMGDHFEEFAAPPSGGMTEGALHAPTLEAAAKVAESALFSMRQGAKHDAAKFAAAVEICEAILKSIHALAKREN